VLSTDKQAPFVGAILRQADCGNTYACVKPDGVNWTELFLNWVPTLWDWLPLEGDHMQNLNMVIEEPAWGYSSGDFTRYYWTKTKTQHGRLVTPSDGQDIPGFDSTETNKWLYLPGVLMHEFGHTAGLTDLYNFDGYKSYLMGSTYDTDRVPSTDVSYIRQVYLYDNHQRH